MPMEAGRKEEPGISKPTRASFQASAECSRRSEGSSSSSLRYGHPFKRYTVSNSLVRENGAQKTRYSRKGDWIRLVLKSRELNGKASKISPEKASRSSKRAWIIGIALAIAVCYLIAEVSVQRSLALLLKGTAAIAAEALTENRAHSFSLKFLPSKDSLDYKVKFVPSKLRERFERQKRTLNESRKLPRSSLRHPRLALLCANLEATPDFLYLITLGKALRSLGYEVEVFSMKDGPMRFAWESTGALVMAIPELDPTQTSLSVDWLNFMQDPFKEVPIVWILLEDSQERPSESRSSSQQNELLLKLFKRADVVLLCDYVLAMRYSYFDTGNFYVIPGSPKYAWDTKEFISVHTREEIRRGLNLSSHDITIAVVGSPFSYKSMWREHALILQAAAEVTQTGGFPLKLLFSSTAFPISYNVALQIMAAEIGLANGSVTYFGPEQELDQLLLVADVVVYSSLREEQSLPSVMLKAMILDCPIIVPNMTIFRDYVHDGINGFMFQGGDRNDLTRLLVRVLSQALATERPHESSSGLHGHIHELLVANIVCGFSELLEGLIQFPSDAHIPSPFSSLPKSLKNWQWQLLEPSSSVVGRDAANDTNTFLTRPGFVPEYHKTSGMVGHDSRGSASKIEKRDALSRADWREFKALEIAEQMERSEEEQLSERNEQLHGTWEEVYRSVRRRENMKNELHEREDGELERTAQPICIYEPYFGAGTWPLLGQKSMMYRGISMIPRQRRSGSDDIEASLRLPLLNHSYYQDVLCDFGAFLAIANRIDRIHKNAWIGFQSWQAAGRKVSLSTRAERLLYDAVNRGDTGDTVYFWASTELDENSSPAHWDFWSYCDAINKGNCRQAFLSAFKEMYGLSSSWTLLPPMPTDGDHWSILHCWGMPTPSFMEFMMFSRMFVSALDSVFYAEHHDKGICTLGASLFEVRHCYCRLLQLLINVWAYHSGRRMVLVDPVDGSMHEQHNLSSRHGQMWVNFFSYDMLKGMDADLAEEADDGTSRRRWLWPRTGEVYCQRIQVRERKQRYEMKLEKKKRDKQRVRRIRGRQRQRPLARG